MSTEESRPKSESVPPGQPESAAGGERPTNQVPYGPPIEPGEFSRERLEDVTYHTPTGGYAAIDSEETKGLRELIANLLTKEQLKRLGYFLLHFHDDRVVKAKVRYDSHRSRDDGYWIELKAAEEQRQANVHNRLAVAEAELVQLEADCTRARERAEHSDVALADAESTLARSAAAAGYLIEPLQKAAEDDVEAARIHLKGAANQKRKATQVARELYSRMRSRTQSATEADVATDSDYAVEAALHADEARAAEIDALAELQRGRHNGYKVQDITAAVTMEEAAADLGVPLYSGLEITSDELEEALSNKTDARKRPSWVKLAGLQHHHKNDRRFRVPLLPEPALKLVTLALGLILGLALAVALQVIAPGDVLKALSPVNSAKEVLISIVNAFLEIGRAFGLTTQANIPTDGEAPRLMLIFWVIGFYIAKVSRYAVMSLTMPLGEEVAMAKHTPTGRSAPPWRNAFRIFVAFFAAAVPLFMITYAEVQLEQSSFRRLIMAERVENARQAATISSSETTNAEELAAQSENRRILEEDTANIKSAAFYAGLLILSGYLLYAAGEGFFRGRDTVIRSSVASRYMQLLQEKRTDAGITPQTTAQFVGDYNHCLSLAAVANLNYRELYLYQLKAVEARYAIQLLKNGLLPRAIQHPGMSPETRQAWSEWIGAQSVLDRTLSQTYASDLAQLRLELEEIESKLAQVKRINEQAQQGHVREGEEAEDQHDTQQLVHQRIRTSFALLFDYLEADIKRASQLRAASRGGWFAKVRSSMFAREESVTNQFVVERIQELRELIKAMRDELDSEPLRPDAYVS